MKIVLIPGCKNYFAGENGNIYCNLPRAWQRGIQPLRIVNTSLQTNKKYLKVSIIINGKRKCQRVHRLICMSFNGPPPNKKSTVSHMDGNAFNNKYTNLKWMSLSDNHKLKWKHGTDDTGVKNSRAKIKNSKDLKLIRKLLNQGKTHKSIGEKFGVSRCVITNISLGNKYKGQGL